MSTTRMLVLGVVRIFQPVHGYFVRRELLSWQVEEWASVNPGSIYHALGALTRDELLAEVDTETSGARPARTTYRLTQDGENEFLRLLRDAVWEVDAFDDQARLLGGLSFAGYLRREEMVDAMTARRDRLDAMISSAGHSLKHIQSSHASPAETAELFLVTSERIKGERRWVDGYLKRLQGGYYRFAGEPGVGAGPRLDGSWPGPLDPYEESAIVPAPERAGAVASGRRQRRRGPTT